MLLPSAVPGPISTGLGRDLLIPPFISTPARDVFLAIEKPGWERPEVSSIFRVTPADASWSSFSAAPVDGELGVVTKLAYNPGDGLYAVGLKSVTTGLKRNTQTVLTWTVRRSQESDQGNPNTWLTDDSFQFTGTSKGKAVAYNSRAHGAATDSSGNVYVCGWASDGRVNHWIIRRKSTAVWAKVFDTAAADAHSIPYSTCFVPQVGNNPTEALFVAGILNNRWTVLRSQNADALVPTWQTVGPWPADGSMASACDVASDSNGNIYVLGVRGQDGQNRGWVVRRSTNGGQNWEDLLDQPSQNDSWAVRLTIDGANNITVAGSIDGASGTPRWAVVRNSPGQLWSDSWTARTFPLGENVGGMSKGRGMVADASGNLLLTGDVIESTATTTTTYVGLLRMVP